MSTNIRTSHKGIWSVDLERYIPFSIFENEAASRGYRAKDRRPEEHIIHNGFTIRSNNGVDCELKVVTKGYPEGKPKVVYIAGFKNAEAKTLILRQEIESKGMVIVHDNRDYLFIQLAENVMDGFWELVDCVENINTILRSPGGPRRSITINPHNYAIASAEVLYTAQKYGMPVLLGRGADIFDNLHVKKLVTKGYSIAGRQQLTTKNAYCEHIVPCAWIEKTALEMYKNNYSVQDVADMIQRNLAVAYISDAEADLLNNYFKWKTTMPPNWKDGDNVIDRLTQAGIIMT